MPVIRTGHTSPLSHVRGKYALWNPLLGVYLLKTSDKFTMVIDSVRLSLTFSYRGEVNLFKNLAADEYKVD